MIETLKGRDTQRFYAGRRIKRFEGFEHQAERRLAVLEAAPTIETAGRASKASTRKFSAPSKV